MWNCLQERRIAALNAQGRGAMRALQGLAEQIGRFPGRVRALRVKTKTVATAMLFITGGELVADKGIYGEVSSERRRVEAWVCFAAHRRG